MLKYTLLITVTLSYLSLVTPSNADDYIIFSVVQDIYMGTSGEIPKKNYYVNIGKHQGVTPETTLDVFRTISRVDPYSSKKRYDYKLKIGELKILHSEDNASIGKLAKLNIDNDSPLYEIDGFMIGDKVDIHLGR